MVIAPAELRGAAAGARLQHQLPPSPARRPGQILAGWMMIEVFDTTAARIALARRRLGCPGCGQPLRPWGHARQRTVRELGGTRAAVRPDRALCTGCGVTHVVLDAGLLPRRAYAAETAGRALVAAALGRGHRRIACDLGVPAGTVRGWIRSARRSAEQLRVTGIRAVVALDPDALPTAVRPDELGCALEHLAAAALAMGDRFGLQHTSLWARINVLTRGQLLAMAPAG
jgi:transposase-like protein